MTVGDLNHDPRTNLAVIQPKMAGIQLQNEDGTFAPPVLVLSEPARNFRDVAIADLNGDSFEDIVL